MKLRPVSLEAGGPLPAPAAPRATGAAGNAAPDTFARVIVTVGRSHQMDDLFVTQWDTTRCSAASAVAMTAFAGPAYVERLADWVVDQLQARVDAVWALVDGLDAASREERNIARAAFLPELQRHIHAFKLSLGTALFELGYEPSKTSGVGVGVPPHLGEEAVVVSDGEVAVGLSVPNPMTSALDIATIAGSMAGRQWFVRDGVGLDSVKNLAIPAVHAAIPWFRVTDAPAKAVELQSKDLDLAGATQVLAAYQLTNEELKLADRVVSCLEAELVKAQGTLAALRGSRRPADAQLLQQLADSVLVAQQHSAVGLNAAETAEALKGAGVPITGVSRAIPWGELGRAAAAGEFLLLEGRSHAVAFGRLPDGRAFLYDSEGIGGDRTGTCLALVEPNTNPAIDAHYGDFQATHRCRAARVLDVIAWQANLRS